MVLKALINSEKLSAGWGRGGGGGSDFLKIHSYAEKVAMVAMVITGLK